MNLFKITHIIFSIIPIFAAIILFYNKKGYSFHKSLGWLFVICMAVSVLSTFFIPKFGQLSFIHILLVMVIYWLVKGIYAIRYKKVKHWKRDHIIAVCSAFISIPIALIGVIIRHYMDPGNVLLGGIASGLTALVLIPVMNKILKNYFIEKNIT